MKITVTDLKTQPLQERNGRKIQVLFDGVPAGSEIQLMTVEYPAYVVSTANHSHGSSQTILVLEGVLTIARPSLAEPVPVSLMPAFTTGLKPKTTRPGLGITTSQKGVSATAKEHPQ